MCGDLVNDLYRLGRGLQEMMGFNIRKTEEQIAGQRPDWNDAIAGLSIAGLLIPEAVAYSSIANMPAQAGLIALMAGLICYGLAGTSRFAIVSATSSSAAVLAAATMTISNGDNALRPVLALGLVIVTGVMFLLAGLAKMGKVTDFISKPVLRGFAFGLAVVIILKQFSGMTGVHPAHGDVIRFLPELLSRINQWNFAGVAIGMISLALLFLFSKVKHLPGGLIVICLGIFASHLIDLTRYGVSLVGTIDLRLQAPSLPSLPLSDWLRLGELGFAMVMILYSESYGSIRIFAMKHGDTTSPNRDLLALGVSNLISGLLHGMPVGVGYSATSANESAGATSKMAGLFSSLVIFAIMLTLLESIALTPQPVLGAIVIHAVSHTLNGSMFAPYFKWKRDRLVIVAAVAGVLLLGVLDGLLVAIGVSLMMMLRQFSESRISTLGRLGQGHDFVDIAVHPEACPIPGILIIRPDEPLFFANVERILSQVRHAIRSSGPAIHTVILSLEESPDLDTSSLEALRDFIDFVTKEGKQYQLARLKHPVHEILKLIVPHKIAEQALSGLSVDDAVQLALQYHDALEVKQKD